MKKYFEFEGEQLRIRSLGPDSGIRDMGMLNVTKWVLESKRGGPQGDLWEKASTIYLANASEISLAIKRFGFDPKNIL
jgi:hypothetical protein